MSEKHCLKCRHCMVDMGESAYSEYTPGSPGVISCWKERWKDVDENTGEVKRVLAKNMEYAATCPDFEEEKL